WGSGPATGNGSTSSTPLSAASTQLNFDPARIVCSLPSYRYATFFIESILGFQSTQQYTLGVHLLLKVVDHVLVAMFLLGGFGSAFVIVISFAEDMHELFSKND
ncbi:MAG: hypothetical protein WBG23_01665, partial [Acidobacteriaceae bacterium]